MEQSAYRRRHCIVRRNLQTVSEDLFVHTIVLRLTNCHISCYLSLELGLRQAKHWRTNNTKY